MITVIEQPPQSCEQYEFKEASTPDEFPGWTVHAIVERQHTEKVMVMKSHVVPGQSYFSSASDEESHVVTNMVYLVRRRVDKAMEEMACRVEHFRSVASALEREKHAEKTEFDRERLELRNKAAEAERSHQNVLAANEVLKKKIPTMERMEADLAKLRDHLGSAQFNLIIGMEKP